jgi:hypothetical protein
MSYWKATAGSTVDVHDFKSLMGAWATYRNNPDALRLVRHFNLHGPITDAQRRRLPKALLTRLRCRVKRPS